ncbi:MAG: hypothetical protein ACRD13_08515 [Terriglobales bacterium]
MEPMYLPEIEAGPGAGPYAQLVATARANGAQPPQIFHLFAHKAEATEHLARFTHAVLRGPSDLSPGLRELIAAFTSRGNDCEF